MESIFMIIKYDRELLVVSKRNACKVTKEMYRFSKRVVIIIKLQMATIAPPHNIQKVNFNETKLVGGLFLN